MGDKKKFPEWAGLNRKIRWARAQVPGFKDEEAFRAMLEEIGGERSLADMSRTGMARVVDHFAREYKIEFEHVNKKKPYQARAAGRRTDFYEIPDGPSAPQMRKILMLWKSLGYSMTAIDTRVKAQFGVEAFRWLTDPAMLDTLARDLNKRLGRKEKKAAARA